MVKTTISANTISRINASDTKAFAELYNAYFTYLCVCATSYVKDANHAQEIVNDIFISLWQHREQLSWPIHSYIMKSLRNASLNHLRSLKQEEAVLELDMEYVCSETPLQYAEVEELSRRVNTIAESLPARCREIFKLYFFYGYDAKDIARRLNISDSTVRVQIKIALDRLKAQLGPISLILLAWLEW